MWDEEPEAGAEGVGRSFSCEEEMRAHGKVPDAWKGAWGFGSCES